MTENPPVDEQLRRLKNTVMGAGHRLSMLAESRALPAQVSAEVASVSRELAQAAQHLERLLATLHRNA